MWRLKTPTFWANIPLFFFCLIIRFPVAVVGMACEAISGLCQYILDEMPAMKTTNPKR